MKQVEERYISLLTDFGFKRIFGSAPNKDLLICFLNSLFNGRQVVMDVKYLNPENVGDIYTDRKAIFDVYCEGENGEKFIVEMQNAYQTYFKDRALFYSTFPIREQAPKGSEWDFKLNHVYTIALLNFNTRFTPQEQREYEASKMAYRDIKNSIDTAKREGKEEGLAEGMEKGLAEGMEKGLAEGMEKGLAEGMEKGLAEGMEKGMNKRSLEIARKMLANGMDAATVMEITGLSEIQLQQLKG